MASIFCCPHKRTLHAACDQHAHDTRLPFAADLMIASDFDRMLLQEAAELLQQEAAGASDFARRMLQALQLCESSNSHPTALLPDPEPMDFGLFPDSPPSGKLQGPTLSD